EPSNWMGRHLLAGVRPIRHYPAAASFCAVLSLRCLDDVVVGEGRIVRYFVRLAVVLCCTVAGFHVAPASAEKCVALVIGNGSYAHIAGLPNVPNDVAAMAALFKSAKFDSVDVRHNLRVAELRRALREFAAQAADADVAVLFYAGHGIEVG